MLKVDADARDAHTLVSCHHRLDRRGVRCAYYALMGTDTEMIVEATETLRLAKMSRARLPCLAVHRRMGLH
jgi:hypothetical protein